MEKDQVTPPLPDRIATAIDHYCCNVQADAIMRRDDWSASTVEARAHLDAAIAEVVAERDAATRRADVAYADRAATGKANEALRAALVAVCNAATDGHCAGLVSMDFLMAVPGEASKCYSRLRTDLAAAQAKLAEVDRKRQILADIAVEAAGWLAGLAGRPSCSCDPGDLAKRLLSIAAAEQGGAQ
jgi:hypothetical protein